MRPRTEIVATSIQDGAVRVEFGSGDAVTVDQIYLATGYKPALARVPFIASGNLGDHIATQNGSPALDDAMQSTRSGLYFTSMLATEMFGPFFAFTLAPALPHASLSTTSPAEGEGRYISTTSCDGAMRSSTKVFHSWQCGHCQSSSVERYRHFRQTCGSRKNTASRAASM
jgi:hypothetical protein